MRARTRLLDDARPFLQFAFDEPPVLLGRARHDFGADAREALAGFGLRDAFDDRVVTRQSAAAIGSSLNTRARREAAEISPRRNASRTFSSRYASSTVR